MKNYKILVVDDEPNNIETVINCFEDKNNSRSTQSHHILNFDFNRNLIDFQLNRLLTS